MTNPALAIAVLLAAVSPIVAAEFNKDDMAQTMAAMWAYNANCGGLPPGAKQTVMAFMEMTDRTVLGPAMINAQSVVDKYGKDKFCAEFKPLVEKLDK